MVELAGLSKKLETMRKGQEKLSEVILKVSDMVETGLQEVQVMDYHCHKMYPCYNGNDWQGLESNVDLVIEDGGANKDAKNACEAEKSHHHHHVVCSQQTSCVPAPCTSSKPATKPPKGSKERFIARVDFKVSLLKNQNKFWETDGKNTQAKRAGTKLGGTVAPSATMGGGYKKRQQQKKSKALGERGWSG